MKKNIEETEEIIYAERNRENDTVRVYKKERKKEETNLEVNEAIVGDSIEIMLERLKEGEGEESITDRDLVYNDNESNSVNPITNIRSDKFDLMVEEKQGEYEHKNRAKMKVVEDKEEEKKEGDTTPTETGTEE